MPAQKRRSTRKGCAVIEEKQIKLEPVKDESTDEEVEEDSFVDRFKQEKENIKKENNNHSDEESGSDLEEYDISQHSNNISEYERERLQNVQDNFKMLQDLNLIQAKQEYKQLITQNKSSQKSSSTAGQRSAPATPVVRRTSGRNSKPVERYKPSTELNSRSRGEPVDPDWFKELSPEPKSKSKSKRLSAKEPKKKVFYASKEINPGVSNVIENEFAPCAKEWDQYCKQWRWKTKMRGTTHLDTIEKLGKYEVKDTHYKRVMQERIFSIAVHPQPDNIIAYIGDKVGNIAMWNPDNTGASYIFHSAHNGSPVNCLHFCPDDPTKLYSSGYDLNLKCMNIETGKFETVASSKTTIFNKNNRGFTEFSWPRNNKGFMLASLGSGELWQIDHRQPAKSAKKNTFKIYQKSVRSVDCHPTNEHMCVTCCFDGSISIWDIRNLSKLSPKPLDHHTPHSKAPSGAFYSPITGAKVLSTSYDNTLIVSYVGTDGMFGRTVGLPHDNKTGRWLTKFQARWDPKSDDLFVCGSMGYEDERRRVHVFMCGEGEQGEPECYSLQHRNYKSITSVNAFHPSRDVLVGGNSSGVVCVWTPNS